MNCFEKTTAALLCCMLLSAGCSSCGDDDNNVVNNATPDAGADASSPTADVSYLLIDVGDDDPVTPCPTVNIEGGALLALDPVDALETFLAPDNTETELTIDYEVTPPAVVDRLTVHFDFDPRLMLEDLVYDQRCPVSIPIAELAEVADEQVISGVVSATDEQGFGARRGRVTLSTGTGEATLLTDGLGDDADPDDGDWYFVFEPAAGRTRLLLAPANVNLTTYTQDNVPDLAGSIGVILTDEIEWNPTTRTAYAPPGFTSSWRQRAAAWHGRLRRRGEDESVVQRLEPMVPAGAIVASHTLAGTIQQDFDPTTHLVLQATGADATLRVPCDALPLDLVAAGFVELTVGDLVVGSGERAVLTAECSGSDPVELIVSSNLLVQRPQTVIIARQETPE